MMRLLRREEHPPRNDMTFIIGIYFLLNNVLRILIRKQRGLTACMPEQNSLIFLEESLANQINHSSGSAASVNRVKQESFVAGK
jgi:hypothetical protein